ncbi:GDNF-inducible zinc finger protein 1 [Cylas formicarius]|uniref:GDNF-inducible zinc finger protein 1 n=1 Tax=Cylas formicarius TaxID=197179 RepID=UPI0029589832|nr:GDNF-inducible zinc finger protein 1 [Cylas formicarius]XP_060534179.1 GDNF-inducible zinc finger protein 1 [Cylas formicarius]XP_060534180.1 GDNF-inducible zinc finger protein 1 [Cylas formicarius]
MYSLYRAWLSLGPGGHLPALPMPVPLNLSLPTPAQVPDAPDVTLEVGPTMTHFSAHKAVLAAHSGFFKAALSNHAGSAPIAVSSVNVDEFSSLLTFMYTGYLDLNIANIYNILLATHILHMPRALELCRNFLLQQNQHQQQHHHHLHHQQQQQPQDLQRVNVIKPIPSRKPAPPTRATFTPAALGGLTKSEDTPFKRVKPDSTAKASTSREAERKPGAKSKRRSDPVGNDNEKVIVDIACCDGPVRFHRVVNKNYGTAAVSMDATENNRDVRELINRNEAMNKVMSGNIMEKLGGEENQNNGEVFTCVYCNHTFKSQYCYQKHARRHLYPVTTVERTSETKREVKLLDMNVQYYPCKTCGSKFPSYYFVHKHRKMCHADEVADKDNKNNVIEVENAADSGGGGSSTCSSAIDVEAVNNENQATAV